jgi:starvation-inducible DNA-binding protein
MPTRSNRESKAARIHNPDGLQPEKVRNLSSVLNALLADVFALYIKTKNFHRHMNGPHFRGYHLLLDEQSQQIFAMTDDLAERVRKIGGTTIHSIGEIARL